ncbi:MAG TPA: DNA polymerase ligase N-terminal domain-containing protein [Saprospiraceae bacterium]|nr:DNA polymerase ligase N-terminal domain-containing protein [Saprospiraceae bacterium]
MPLKNHLSSYKKKRNLGATPEPSGQKKSKRSAKSRFVIQKHAARNLHYDFRLEINSVLVSWAVPKGPSTDPREKRLAVQIEDHPVDYADFEGVIPEGNYGAGTVMVWDNGTYHNVKEDENGKIKPIQDCLADGHILIWLDGKKLKGGYALTRFRKKENQWLLVKMKDDESDARRNPVKTENASAKTGRTMEEIARRLSRS